MMTAKLKDIVPTEDWHKVIANFNMLYAELRIQEKKLERVPDCMDLTVQDMLTMWNELDALSNRIYDNIMIIQEGEHEHA